MSDLQVITEAFEIFKNHYANRLGRVETEPLDFKNIKTQFIVKSEKLRDGNYPTVFFHGQKTKDVIVLTHGLTDSPYYMKAIGERFYREGLNVILPLLPAHGLKDPDEAMDDKALNEKWPKEIDQAVEVALLLGDRVSLGGFSTGGALSLNKILKEPKKIKGCLFLFSGAIDLGFADETARSNFICSAIQFVLEIKEGKLAGDGPNQYKYPELPKSTGVELCQIIQDNERLLHDWKGQGKKISNPVFAAHSVHDETIEITNSKGIIHFLTNHVNNGLAFLISEKVLREVKSGKDIEVIEGNVRHEEVVLAQNIELREGPQFDKWQDTKQPLANPKFNLMMDTASHFFKDYLI